MELRQDWTEQLGLILYEDEVNGHFWVEIPEPPIQKVALIPENRAMLTKYVETYVNQPVDRFNAQEAICWALLESVMQPDP